MRKNKGEQVLPNMVNNQKYNNLVFIIIPLLLFIFMLFRLAEIHFFFQAWIDPVYAYLMNGLTFALGSNDIGHTDHPGTPLQLFIGLLITIIGWIHHPGDLATDVLSHPEYYLRIISLVLIIINCTMIGMLGYFAFKNLKNRSMAISIQLLPLLSFQLLNYMPIAACETVITFVSIAMAACIILYESKNEGKLIFLILLAFLSALMISTKISTLTILLVPFFYFEKIKSKSIYLGLTLLLIILFLLPVMNKLVNFTSFLGKIATHTGQYGSGEAKLFDMGIFFHSLKLMLIKEYTFTLHVLLLSVGWAVIAKQHIKGSLRRLYMGISMATVFQMMIVARHYGFHYLMPIFALCMPLHGYFWIQIFKQKISKVPFKIMSITVIILITGVFLRLVIKNNFDSGIINQVEKTTKVVQNELKGKYIIITENNNDAAFIETALRFGLSYSGPTMKAEYTPILASLYPGNYLWNSYDGFTDWTGNYLASEIFLSKEKIYIYANTASCELSREKISGMINQVEMTDFVSLKYVWQNEKTGEVIAEALVNTTKLEQYNQSIVSIETGMEELTSDGNLFTSNNPQYNFKGGNLQSGRYVRSGKKSLLLTPSNPYGLNISLPISLGTRFKVELWQKSSGQKQAIVVAAASKNELYYKTSTQNFNPSAAWNRTELNISIPKDYPESAVNFYLWNPSQDSIWVDDFRLFVFK